MGRKRHPWGQKGCQRQTGKVPETGLMLKAIERCVSCITIEDFVIFPHGTSWDKGWGSSCTSRHIPSLCWHEEEHKEGITRDGARLMPCAVRSDLPLFSIFYPECTARMTCIFLMRICISDYRCYEKVPWREWNLKHHLVKGSSRSHVPPTAGPAQCRDARGLAPAFSCLVICPSTP